MMEFQYVILNEHLWFSKKLTIKFLQTKLETEPRMTFTIATDLDNYLMLSIHWFPVLALSSSKNFPTMQVRPD
jgi:hypothetical protein